MLSPTWRLKKGISIMNYEYKPQGVCARKMDFLIENNIIKDMRVIGGCPGNSLGVRAFCINKDIDTVINTLKDIKCAARKTSCPDQIAQALINYKKEIN